MDAFLDLIVDLQDTITRATTDGAMNLIDPLMGLALLLGALAIATNFEMYFTPGSFNPGNLIIKAIQIGFCFWLIQHWIPVIDMVAQSGMALGSAAGGTDGYLTPDTVIRGGIKQVFSASENLWASISLKELPIYLIGIIVLAVALYAFFRIAFTIFMTTAEFSIVGSLAVILVPFMLTRWTSSIAEKAWGILLASFVKLTVATFMVSLLANEIQNAFGGSGSLTDAKDVADKLPELITAALSIFFLSWVIGHVVDYAGDMVRGMAPGNTPSLRDMARGSVGIARGTANTVRTGYRGGRMVYRGAKTGYQKVKPVAGKVGQWWLKYGNGVPIA